jgi:hypothetical protein
MFNLPFSKILIEDELKFLNRSLIKLVVVYEVIAQVPEDEWRPAPVVADGAVLVRLLRRPSGIDAANFRQLYEDLQVPAILSEVNRCIEYRCNYVCRSDSYNFTTPELQEQDDPVMIDCDLVEEFYFTSSADAEAAKRAVDAVGPHSPLLEGILSSSAIICDQRLRRT